MEIGAVRQVDIEQEVQQSYLDYAMSVIVSRALPDVRDGLKPVQRRVLYAMYDMGLRADKPYKKCARIVGEVLGKYHPHSEVPVYEALVRMAQDFTMRYLLVDGQGNFGSNDGDGAAAMRYTEARLHQVGEALLTDIEKETVDFGPNFDATLTEPLVLPTGVPNLLVNGASGIAVGMATNIPPHNLGEVCDALIYLIEQSDRAEDVSVEELMQFVHGPDFPTGGIVYRLLGSGSDRVDALENAYAVGRGRFMVQSKAHFEEMSRSRNRIVVTELPYQVNKARLSERIAELARDGRIEGIADLRDESDRQGMRLVIELTRTADPREVLAQLFKLTPMQSTYGLIMLALVDGEPRLLPLKRVLQLFLDHRREIVTRRSQHDLNKARQRSHILEGLRVALENLDEVIRLIRRSPSAEEARVGLMKKFKLTEIQAQAILDLQLRRLAALERQKIEEEYAEVNATIRRLEDLLSSPRKVMGVVKDEIKALKARYGDARRTQIVIEGDVSLTARDLADEANVVVAVSSKGQIRVVDQTKASSFTRVLEGEAASLLAWGSLRDDLCAVDSKGTAAIVGVHRLPFDERTGWSPASDTVGLPRESRVAGVACLRHGASEEAGQDAYIVAATKTGKVKRTAVSELSGIRGVGALVGVDAEDEIVGLFATSGGQDILLMTALGKAIRFKEDEVRSMGLGAGGVLGIRLTEGDRVVSAASVGDDSTVVSVSAKGLAKRCAAAEYPTQARYGQGVAAFPVSEKGGQVAAGLVVDSPGTVAVATSDGRVYAVEWDQLANLKRASQGKPAVSLRAGETVSTVVFVPKQESIQGEESQGEPAAGEARQLALGERDARPARPTTKRRGVQASAGGATGTTLVARTRGRTAAPSSRARADRGSAAETSNDKPGGRNSRGKARAQKASPKRDVKVNAASRERSQESKRQKRTAGATTEGGTGRASTRSTKRPDGGTPSVVAEPKPDPQSRTQKPERARASDRVSPRSPGITPAKKPKSVPTGKGRTAPRSVKR